MDFASSDSCGETLYRWFLRFNRLYVGSVTLLGPLCRGGSYHHTGLVLSYSPYSEILVLICWWRWVLFCFVLLYFILLFHLVSSQPGSLSILGLLAHGHSSFRRVLPNDQSSQVLGSCLRSWQSIIGGSQLHSDGPFGHEL